MAYDVKSSMPLSDYGSQVFVQKSSMPGVMSVSFLIAFHNGSSSLQFLNLSLECTRCCASVSHSPPRGGKYDCTEDFPEFPPHTVSCRRCFIAER